MSVEVKAQNTTTLASVKAIYDAADEANTILDGMQTAATAAGTTLNGIYADAEEAKTNATAAQTAAGNAQQSADSALVSLSTVQDVVGVLNWITAHGTMTLTSDVTVNPAHVYFVVDPAGDYVVGGTHYSIVSEPKDAELSTYYELTVDESVQNYMVTHVAVDSEGLWIIPDTNGTPQTNGKKILIATGAGSTYTTAGTYIIDRSSGTNTTMASFRANGATIGENASGKSRTEISPDGMEIIRNDGGTDTSIATLGYGVGNTSSDTTSYKPYYTFGQRETTTDAYDSTHTYNCGDLCVHDGQLYVCKFDNITGNWNSSAWLLSRGNWSVAEGYNVIAGGTACHAEGINSKAIYKYSHAEGEGSLSSGWATHAEGHWTRSSGVGSHAEGSYTHAEGYYSHAGGNNTYTRCKSQTVIGEFNAADPGWDAVHKRGSYVVMIGNGTAENARSNALTVDWSGNVMGQGMAGMIQMFAGSTAPTGWLICDGSAVSRTDYATLFDVIGTTYGAGDGSTTFNLPDFSGRMPIGVGESTADGHTAHTLAEADGKEAYKLTGAQSGVQAHNHIYYDYDTTYSFPNGYRTTTDHSKYALISATASRANHQRTTNNNTANDATDNHTNMPPYLGINFIIATGKTD